MIAAGWYADPWRMAQLRWWDGTRWTPYLFPGVTSKRSVPSKGPGIRGGGIAGVGAAAGSVASIVVSVVIAVMTAQGGGSLSPWFVLLAEVPIWAGFLGAALLASRRNGTGNFGRDFGLSKPTLADARLGVLGGVVGRVIPTIYLVLIVIALHVTRSSTGLAPRVLGITPQGASGWIVLIVLTVVGAPIVEEIFFRGLIQGAFNRRCGAVASLFITAVIFSVAHVPGEGPFAPFLLFPMAVVLGYLRLKTDRLAAGMLAHAEFNAIGLLIVIVPAFH